MPTTAIGSWTYWGLDLAWDVNALVSDTMLVRNEDAKGREPLTVIVVIWSLLRNFVLLIS